MIVALDTTPLYTTRAGVARYVNGLTAAFLNSHRDHVTIKPLSWPVDNISYEQPLRRATKTLYRELVWARTKAPGAISRMNAEILHTTQRMPISHAASIRCVTTLHDCSVLIHPQRFRTWTRLTARLYMKRLLDSDKIICISRFTADEAMRLLDISHSKLEVIHLGNGLDLGSTDQDIPSDLVLPDTFFLFVGSLEPGKNLQLLLDVYNTAKHHGVFLPPLVIVGERWSGVRNEKEAPDNWIYAGRQPDCFLAQCYRRARALLFPSKYEGFGFPVLEAMSMGCPVICSPVASLPEIAGDAAVYADQNVTAYMTAITDLLNNPSFQEEKRAAGIEQAKHFSWEKCAKETLTVYKSVL